MNIKQILFFTLFLLASGILFSQKGIVRGNVFDISNGEPLEFVNVSLEGTTFGSTSDIDGFFSLAAIPAGEYNLIAQFIGYDVVSIPIKVRDGGIVYERIVMKEGGVLLEGVEVSARKTTARTDVQVSKISVSKAQIKSLPSTGGVADIAQYLPVLPGVVVSGDQGGQLYIRGGSPIQNKILLDGMTIYNPFHSIGFFSVFETEAIKSVDVLTGGFNAEYGGRISAVVDIKTREGNKKRISGKVGVSPFQARAILEGPIKKLDESGTGGSSSFLLTGKQSLLAETSRQIYTYVDSIGLPYSYTDLYGKLSFVAGNGSKLNLFGFNFNDQVNFVNVADLNWQASGGGLNFSLLPPSSNILVGGTASFSDYNISLMEGTALPRTSKITTFNIIFDFTYYGSSTEVNYGIEFNGFNTEFAFNNFLGLTIDQRDFTTEIAGFVQYKKTIGNLIIEPGLRGQYYASQPEFSLEPRIGLKYNISDNFRFKFAGGLYSQNLVSTVNDNDIVNLFVGFLAGPGETIFRPDGVTPADNRLQKSIHGIAGLEIDLTKRIEFNVEPYYKNFTQLITLNRNKLSGSDPNFSTETGLAYGIDFSLRYDYKDTYIWATYSNAYVNRDDGQQIFPTNFDRRNNVNLLVTQNFGEDKSWSASARWNLGTGFPFTLTQGFYGQYNFSDGINTDYISGNPLLGVLFDEDRNAGRLPSYHRLDLSLTKNFKFTKYSELDIIFSLTNAYNRDNIFFFDRIEFERVDQLPILPSLAVDFAF